MECLRDPVLGRESGQNKYRTADNGVRCVFAGFPKNVGKTSTLAAVFHCAPRRNPIASRELSHNRKSRSRPSRETLRKSNRLRIVRVWAHGPHATFRAWCQLVAWRGVV